MDFYHNAKDLLSKMAQDPEFRPKIRLTPEELLELQQSFQEALKDKHWENVQKNFFIIEYLERPNLAFLPCSLEILEGDLGVPSKVKIAALVSAWKHGIEALQRQGASCPDRFIQALKSSLHHPELEVRIWTLRTILQLGNQGLRLKEEIDHCLPSWYQVLTPQQFKYRKLIKKLIVELKKKWAK